jgi:hypothetical protein
MQRRSIAELRNKARTVVMVVFLFFFVGSVVGCASKFLKYDKREELSQNKEFDSIVKIEAPAVEPSAPSPAPTTEVKPESKPASKKESSKALAKKKKAKKDAPVEPEIKPSRRQPELESDVGFEGRRPLKDPFRVGEKVTHRVHYFNVSAGNLTFEVKPFVYVNGRKSYKFRTSIVTSSLFSSFYAADDYSETLVDFEELVPSVFTLHVQETGQLKEGKSFFNFQTKKALYWETKVTKKNGKEEKKLEWDIDDYSQNVFSAAYYMRNFQWKVGEEIAFRVADDGENILFRGKAIRSEKIETEVGTFDALVIKPEFELKGVFKPVGDIYIWLSNDDRKYILKIESKIKIGTLVSEITELVPGNP